MATPVRKGRSDTSKVLVQLKSSGEEEVITFVPAWVGSRVTPSAPSTRVSKSKRATHAASAKKKTTAKNITTKKKTTKNTKTKNTTTKKRTVNKTKVAKTQARAKASKTNARASKKRSAPRLLINEAPLTGEDTNRSAPATGQDASHEEMAGGEPTKPRQLEPERDATMVDREDDALTHPFRAVSETIDTYMSTADSGNGSSDPSRSKDDSGHYVPASTHSVRGTTPSVERLEAISTMSPKSHYYDELPRHTEGEYSPGIEPTRTMEPPTEAESMPQPSAVVDPSTVLCQPTPPEAELTASLPTSWDSSFEQSADAVHEDALASPPVPNRPAPTPRTEIPGAEHGIVPGPFDQAIGASSARTELHAAIPEQASVALPEREPATVLSSRSPSSPGSSSGEHENVEEEDDGDDEDPVMVSLFGPTPKQCASAVADFSPEPLVRSYSINESVLERMKEIQRETPAVKKTPPGLAVQQIRSPGVAPTIPSPLRTPLSGVFPAVPSPLRTPMSGASPVVSSPGRERLSGLEEGLKAIARQYQGNRKD